MGDLKIIHVICVFFNDETNGQEGSQDFKKQPFNRMA